MKKLFAIMLAAAVCFAACDDNTGNTPGGDKPEKITAEVTYMVDGGDDLLSLFDITAVYTDETGASKEQKVAEMPCEIKLPTIENLPFEASIELKLTERADYPEKEKYSVGLGAGIIYSLTDGTYYNSMSTSTQEFAANKIEAYKKFVMEEKWVFAVTVGKASPEQE